VDFPKRNWTFVPPAERIEVSLHIPEKELDWSTERRILAQQYVDRAKDVVDFHFSTIVQSLIVENGTVNGIVANGEKFYADLVVDNSGAMSPFRAQLPKSAHVTAKPQSDEIFVAYRAFHKKADGVKDPQNTNKAYLKHLGEEGISWSIIDPLDAREIIGSGKIIGVSCYGDLERAKEAIKKGADYVAFGSFFPSPTKPHAKVVDKSVLSEAKSLGVPVCAIGGIGINNGGELVTAGADMLSVISALWVGDIYQNASRFSSFYKNLS
jgi:hypothetical protein